MSAVDKEKLPEDIKKAFEEMPDNFKSLYNGVFCGKITEPHPTYYSAPCEKVIKGQNNSYIVLGRDRPSSMQSGFGGAGHTQCSSIDIVAGRMSGINQNVTKEGEEVFCNPSFTRDAARIHISQKTNVDKNFGLVDGGVGNSVERSAIGMKADSIRIIGREGIKLITRTDGTNSRGGTVSIVKGIDLIAGNDDTDLQPIPKGHNVADALKGAFQEIDRLNAVVADMILILLQFNLALGAHTHGIPPIPVFAPSPAGPIPLGIAVGGISTPSTEAATGATMASSRLNLHCQQGVAAQKINIQSKVVEFCEPYGIGYINSRYNRVN